MSFPLSYRTSVLEGMMKAIIGVFIALWGLMSISSQVHAEPAMPDSIVRVGACATPGTAWEVFVQGDYASVADRAYLTVVDVSLPSAPAGMTYLSTNSKSYKQYRWTKDGSAMIKIPAGEFLMGSWGFSPQREVYLDAYYMDKYEVTNSQYKRFCDATGHAYPENPPVPDVENYFLNFSNYPVVKVSWDDAVAYANWAGKRLPTEAEWEKAARGTDGRKYPWGNEEPFDDVGRYYRCNLHEEYGARWDGFEYAAPVGTYERGISPYGLYDMAGNVSEWCQDWWYKIYVGPSRNPKGPDKGTYRVTRSGSFDSSADRVRCVSRNFAWCGHSDVGFRCAYSP